MSDIISLSINYILFIILFVAKGLLNGIRILFTTDVAREIYYNIIMLEIQIIRYNLFSNFNKGIISIFTYILYCGIV